MTEQDLAHLHASFLAEAAGDARRALAHHEAVRPFPDNPHRVMLQQLVELGDAIPTWARARWVVEQVTRWFTADSVSRHHLARDDVLRAAHAMDVDPRRPYGLPVEAFCGLLLGHDWIYRQLVVFEYDGLRDFLETEAGPGLVAGAGPIHAWAGAAMGAFRLEGDGDGRARLTDLSTRTELDVLDIGCTGELDPGDCAIGRVVPIETAPGLMFESRPLPVDAELACRVAAAPDSWLRELTRAYQGGRLPPLYSWREQHPMLTDVPVWVWRYVLEDDAALRRALEGSPLAGDVVGAAVRLCRNLLGLWRCVPPEVRPCMAQLFGAAVVHPGVMPVLRESLPGTAAEAPWREVAAHLVDPMRGRCLELAALWDGRSDVA